MNTINQTSQFSNFSLTTQPAAAKSTSAEASSTAVVASTALPSDTVTLSSVLTGKSLLMSRMFHNNDANASIPVATVDNGSVPAINFLTTTDRSQMSELYDYASKNNIDLAQVDGVAFDLAMYRQSGENSTPGNLYDMQGYKVTYAFPPSDAKVANRILSDTTLKNTSLDHGFIKEVLDPVSTPVHASNLKFLEKVISILSPSGDDKTVTPSTGNSSDYFQSNTKWAPSERIIENKSVDIQFDIASQTEVGKPNIKSRQEIFHLAIAQVLENSKNKLTDSSTLLSIGYSPSKQQSIAGTLFGVLVNQVNTDSSASPLKHSNSKSQSVLSLYHGIQAKTVMKKYS